MKRILLIIVILFVSLGLWRMQDARRGGLNLPYLEEERRLFMDTYVTIFADGPKRITSPAIDAAFERMQQVAEKFNAHNPESPIYAFNNQSTPIRDEEILRVIQTALGVSQKTDGAFDITVYPLLKLWKFYEKSPQLPPEEQIKECLENIGYKHLFFNNGELKKDKVGISIDLGAIAKGYVISQGIEVLKQKGITSALIDAGGDVYALGKKRGKPWKVGIQHPRKDGLLGYVEVADTAIMGSGDYQRFFINPVRDVNINGKTKISNGVKEGKRYSHIFNPQTGYPQDKVMGVTVIHPDLVLADAWATALCVLEPKAGLAIIEKILGMEAMMVSTSGEVLYSSGLKQVFKEK